MPDQPPRRRIADGTPRRRREDKLIDLLVTRQDSQAEDIEDVKAELRAVTRMPPEFAAFLREDKAWKVAFRREFDEWKHERREDIREFRDDISELQRENKVAHKRIAHGRDPENGERLPPQPAKLSWGDVLKVATAVSLVLGPIAVVVAALLSHGGGG